MTPFLKRRKPFILVSSFCELLTQTWVVPDHVCGHTIRQALSLEGSELNRIDATWLHGFRSTTSLLLHTQLPETLQHIRRLVDAVHQFSSDEALSAQADTLWAVYEKAE